MYDRERWWYKLTQASRPPFPLVRDNHHPPRLCLDEMVDYMCPIDLVMVYDNPVRWQELEGYLQLRDSLLETA